MMKANQPKDIYLDRFIPRDYQIPIREALHKGYKNIIAVLPRRSGKDLAVWNAVISLAIKKPIVIWYVLPFYSQAKKAMYDGMTYDGHGYIDHYIPKELIASKSRQELKVTLIPPEGYETGSLIQFIGSDKFDRLRGAGPSVVVFSEAAFQLQESQTAILPMIIASNDPIVIYVSTPNGKNWFFDLWMNAKKNKKWFCYLQTVEDTKHISLEDINALKELGQLSEEAIQSEFYCSWDRGVEGSIYGRAIQDMRFKKQIGLVPYDPDYPVHTAWDLGIKDPSVILFAQCIDRVIHIIDCYDATDQGQTHFARIIKAKPYLYGVHIFPPDVFVREQATGVTRYERLVNLEVQPTCAGNNKKILIEDGIEAVRSELTRTWIDENSCRPLIKAMENYHYQYDAKNNIYSQKPVHDQWSHYADALRYLMISLPSLMHRDSTPEELDRRYREAMYGGGQSNLPAQFVQPKGQGGMRY
jgi:phage terminase large subunit